MNLKMQWESLKVASEITDPGHKSMAYSKISNILMDQGKEDESQDAMQESLKVASEITDSFDKSRAYLGISKVLIGQRKKDESLKVASQITDVRIKSNAYLEISNKLIEQGRTEESLYVAANIDYGKSRKLTFTRFEETLHLMNHTTYNQLLHLKKAKYPSFKVCLKKSTRKMNFLRL